MSLRAETAAFALALTSAGCVAVGPSDPIGAAREGDGTRPLVGFPTDVAPAEAVPMPVPNVFFASRGQDYVAVWPVAAPGASGIDAIRFGEDGAPASTTPIHLTSFPNELEPAVLGVSCAPAGDCVVVSAAEGLAPTIRVSTLRADGSKATAVLPSAFFEPSLGSVAFDPAAGSFLVVYAAPNLQALHFADGAQVEADPLPIADDSNNLSGLACSPSDGCLVLFIRDQTSTTGAIVTAAGVSAPMAIADIALTLPTYGDGVHFALEPSGNTPHVVRLGLDGTALDTTPIPIGNLTQKFKLLAGAPAFDGSAFVALLTAFDVAHAKHTNVVQGAFRIRADGTEASPAEVDLSGLSLEGPLACGDGTCEVALTTDAKGAAALSTAALRGGTATPSASDLLRARGSQDGGTALSLGGKVLVAWSEGSTLRSRWFDGTGRVAGPPRDLDEPRRIAFFDSDGDAALLVLEGDELTRETRVVSADGTIGPAVPFHAPAKPSREHARFAVLEGGPTTASVSVRRFDAEGHPLDPEPISIPRPFTLLAGCAMGRAGDTFIVAFQGTGPDSIAAVARVRDTGEIADITEVLPNASILSAPGGVACSPSECAIAWSGTSSIGGRDTPEVWLTRFSPNAPTPTIKPEFLALGNAAGVVYDGRSFLAAFTRKDELGVARIDAHGRASGHGMLNGDVFRSVAAADGAAIIVTSNSIDLGPLQREAQRLHVRNVLDEAGNEGGSGGSGSGGSTGEIVAGGGCGCELDAHDDPRWCSAALCALAVALAARGRKAS